MNINKFENLELEMHELELEMHELTNEELTSINGGESGWYYLGKAVRAAEDFAWMMYGHC